MILAKLSFVVLPLFLGIVNAWELTRRQAIHHAGVAGVGGLLSGSQPAFAMSNDPHIVSKGKSVLVLGSNGGTGRECVSAVLTSGRSCIATTRSGDFEYTGPNDDHLYRASADVTSFESVREAIQKSKDLGAVIFAASSAKGDAFAVDKQGVINAAKCCIEENIPRLVVVSSGTVTRPDSAVYKLLNTVGKGIMEAKIQGEDAVRDLYANPDVASRNLGYTIIRPGGLTNGVSLGPSELELNQGDSKSGRLSRADVAALCINCLDSSDTFDATFECYEALTAKPIESVGLSNIFKSTDPTSFVSGKERRGATWGVLFKGLETDQGSAIGAV